MKLVTTKFKSGGLLEKHVVATWNLGNHIIILGLITSIIFGEECRCHSLHEGLSTEDSVVLGSDTLPLGECRGACDGH